MSPVFGSFAELWHMSGHGVYVWAAYACALLVLAWLVAVPLAEHRRLRRQLRRKQTK